MGPVNHHGSQTSSNPAFLAALDPQVAIISVGSGGLNKVQYHFPSRAVLDRLLALSRLEAVYMTSRGETIGGLTSTDLKRIRIADGDVVVSTNGQTAYEINDKDKFSIEGSGPASSTNNQGR